MLGPVIGVSILALPRKLECLCQEASQHQSLCLFCGIGFVLRFLKFHDCGVNAMRRGKDVGQCTHRNRWSVLEQLFFLDLLQSYRKATRTKVRVLFMLVLFLCLCPCLRF